MSATILQEGGYWGGLLGFFSGFFATLANLNNPVVVGPNISLSLTVILYFYMFYMILRLDNVRLSRQNELFGNIAPNKKSNIIRYTAFFLLPFASFGIALIPFRDDIVRGSFILSQYSGYVPILPLYIWLLSFLVSIVYIRFVFSFKEVIAAFEHLFSFFSENEVSEENRIHAASVIRLSVETFLLSTLTVILMVEIGLLADVESITSLISNLI